MLSFDRDISKIVMERLKNQKGKLYVMELESRRKSIGIDMTK